MKPSTVAGLTVRLGRILSLTATMVGAACDVPASQTWVVSWMPDCGLGPCGTNVTIDQGGAITQRGPGTKVTSDDGQCTYLAPITGQWSGTIVMFTMSGGCGDEQLQGFTQGAADGEYGSATSAQGRITWTFTHGIPSITQDWTAYLLH